MLSRPRMSLRSSLAHRALVLGVRMYRVQSCGRAWIHLAFLVVLIWIQGCQSDAPPSAPIRPDAAVEVRLSLVPAQDAGFEITRVAVSISRPGYSVDMDLAIDGESASGTFANVPVGTYTIGVELYSGETIIASGAGVATVEAGQTAHARVQITLTGNLSVEVEWITSTTTTYIVAPDGTGDFPTIQAGIDASVDGDTLVLSDGTFRGDGNRDLDFRGLAIVVRSQSGDPSACIVDCEGAVSTPHRGFYFHSGEDTSSVLAGVTVRNGYDAGVFNTGGGGGIRFEASSPLIRECILTDNEAEWVGGGIACYSDAAPLFIECVFAHNVRSAVHADHGDPVFRYCLFYENTGEIHLWASTPTFANCTISHTSSGKVSALFSDGGSSPLLENCIISFGNAVPFACNNSSIALRCCNVFGNLGGDYTGCVAGWLGIDGNFSSDPLFCNGEENSYELRLGSPCLPAGNTCGELVGALPSGCDFAKVFSGESDEHSAVEGVDPRSALP